MPTMYYNRSRGTFQRAAEDGTIAVPDFVHAQVMEDQLSGKNIDRDPLGTPGDVAALLTLAGMRAAVLRWMRVQRAMVLNALTGVGYDAIRAQMTALAAIAAAIPELAGQPTWPAKLAAAETLMTEVDAARLFLKNITADAQVLAVTPETGGWEAMSAVILQKWKAYAASSSSAIRGAFAEVA